MLKCPGEKTVNRVSRNLSVWSIFQHIRIIKNPISFSYFKLTCIVLLPFTGHLSFHISISPQLCVFFWHLLLLLLLLIFFWGLLWPPMHSKLNSLWVQPDGQFPLGPHLGQATEIYLRPVWSSATASATASSPASASASASASTPIWLHFNKGQPISCVPENNKQHLGNSIVIACGFSFIWL